MGKHEDLVRETRAHYEKNPRCMNEDGNCVYDDLNGNNCAVGRILPQYVNRELDKKGGKSGIDISHAISLVNVRSGEIVLTKRTTERLKKLDEEYNKNILYRIQSLHDLYGRWSSEDEGKTNKLTFLGEKFFRKLLKDAKAIDEKETA